MGRDESVQARFDQAVDCLKSALGGAYDDGKTDQASMGSNVPQQVIDAAVEAATAGLKTQLEAAEQALVALKAADDEALAALSEADKTVLAEVQAKVDQALADLQAMTAKELAEEQAVADVQAKVLAVQESFAKILAIIFPQPSV